MSFDPVKIKHQLISELSALWNAHAAVDLKGQMKLYILPSQIPWRTQEEGIEHWFGPEGTEEAADLVLQHYKNGKLPNTPLLLNPIVHQNKKPIGSGLAWATSLCLGVDRLNPQSQQRLDELGVAHGTFQRGDNARAGLKIIAPSNRVLNPTDDGTVEGCRALYDLANHASDQYAPYYLLSGISYLSTHGLFLHPDAGELFAKKPLDIQNILDAARCWNAYERHHSLYVKFGRDPKNIDQNLKFFRLVAHDTKLFDATGPMRADAEASFEFLVEGLIPKGAVTILAASGGVGKSSAAHHLATLAATDWNEDEQPQWLGQKLRKDRAHGVVVYFSGEDGPPIINARAHLFDPQGRAKRLMFQRTDFGDGVTFAEHLKMLHKIPEVPLMVIDPARKYLEGDEEDAGVVSKFFEAIEEFAIEKNAAVVVAHHLAKNANPKAAAEVLEMLRGSQVFIDRPRVVIGMYRNGENTVVGLAKNNIPPNMGMVMEERVFKRDAATLTLIPN